MNLFKATALLALAFTVAACASGGKKRMMGPSPGIQQPSLLLSLARDTQAKMGCTKAIPAYRVISSYGDGYDVAQYELGACLYEAKSTNPSEVNLFKEEALFWLRRSAWADNARAQLKLAQILSGAGENSHNTQTNPEEAMAWSILYNENAKRNLYDLPDVPDYVTNHLNTSLDANATARAVAFADKFQAITMAAFTPPAPPKGSANRQIQRQGRPPDGQKRRRRR